MIVFLEENISFFNHFARKMFGFCCHGFIRFCNVLTSLNIFTFSGGKGNGEDDDDGISNT